MHKCRVRHLLNLGRVSSVTLTKIQTYLAGLTRRRFSLILSHRSLWNETHSPFSIHVAELWNPSLDRDARRSTAK